MTATARTHTADVTVMGAGLTGAVAALELAQAGVRVTLIEQDKRTMNRASLRNEGKIHLGFVFSQDLTAASSNIQLQGALRLRDILTRLIGDVMESLTLSHPCVYLVPEDSIASPDELEGRVRRLEETYHEQLAAHESVDYF